jgi:transcriptional regulator with XRE-family HTH domain
MDRRTFGQIVISLRKDLSDPATGKFWTQTDLAQATGLSERSIGAIERGEKVNLEGGTLTRLAQALRLTALEQREFYLAAQEAAAIVSPLPGREQTARTMQMLRDIYLPAFVCDPLYHLVYLNAQMAAFHGLSLDDLRAAVSEARPVNVLSEFFTPTSNLRQSVGKEWTTVALANLQHFRATSLRYRHTEHFQQLLQGLLALPDFTQLWQASAYPQADMNTRLHAFCYHHATHQWVNYTAARAAIITPATELYLSILVPNDARTAELFTSLGSVEADSQLDHFSWLPA